METEVSELAHQLETRKLVERAKGLVMSLGDVDYETAAELLGRCDHEVKTAVVMARTGVDVDAARARLDAAGGSLRAALDDVRRKDL